MSITRDPQNALLTARNLGNVTEALTYNQYGELATQLVRYNGAEVYSVTYDSSSTHRDALGRVVQKLERVQGVQRLEDYQYDDRGRLTDVMVNSLATEHWDYDANSNRLASSGPCPAEESDYDDQDRLTGCGDYTFTYTANGELASKVHTTQGTTLYQYDVLGNLLSVQLPNSTLIEYLIDGENRRVGKKVNGTVVKRWLYRDTLKPVAELDGTGALVSSFVYASNPNVPDYVIKSGTKYRIVTDQLGSVRMVINVSTKAEDEREGAPTLVTCASPTNSSGRALRSRRPFRCCGYASRGACRRVTSASQRGVARPPSTLSDNAPRARNAALRSADCPENAARSACLRLPRRVRAARRRRASDNWLDKLQARNARSRAAIATAE